jgi:2-isopropylmalate synthase
MDQFYYDKIVEPKQKPKRIRVFDTTMRDGEQTPGVSLTTEDKVQIAGALSDLGVDYIEAGFPASSPGEVESIRRISSMGLKSSIVGLARCVEGDLGAAVDAGCDMVHVFIGTSPTHRKYKLGMGKADVMDAAQRSIQYVLDRGVRVHFSPEDACRTEPDYLMSVCEMADSMGASHINIPDTVGVMTPAAMGKLIGDIKGRVKTPLAVHCHNDFGMAVANTVSAILAGATVAHTTINGLGERAGNASMEQVVLAAKLIHGIGSNIKNKRIWETSRLVERLTGIKVMPNFPIVGGNAFAHEAGIHVHGIIKNARTYEAIKPEYVGTTRRIVMGKHVGKSAVREKLKAYDVRVTEKTADDIARKIKHLADMGKKVTEEDLVAIAEDMMGKAKKSIIELKDMALQSRLDEKPYATVALNVRGVEKTAKVRGVGPVDAALNAIKEAIGEPDLQLDEYHLDAITGGSNALAEVSIRVSKRENTTMAHAVHEDVVMASVNAYLNAVNRLMR